MLRWLRRPKAQLNIEVPGGPSFHPGDSIKVLVILSPQETFYVRRGWIELLCIEQHNEQRQGEEGSYTVRVFQEPYHRSESFLSDTEVTVGIPCRYEVTFSLPDDVPPTMKGGIDWHIRASLDITGGRDVHRAFKIEVLSWRRPGTD